MSWAHLGTVILAAFLASLVEFVEALTIVLAVGTTRGCRLALIGAGAVRRSATASSPRSRIGESKDSLLRE
jgi:uncharacterized membrane protein